VTHVVFFVCFKVYGTAFEMGEAQGQLLKAEVTVFVPDVLAYLATQISAADVPPEFADAYAHAGVPGKKQMHCWCQHHQNLTYETFSRTKDFERNVPLKITIVFPLKILRYGCRFLLQRHSSSSSRLFTLQFGIPFRLDTAFTAFTAFYKPQAYTSSTAATLR